MKKGLLVAATSLLILAGCQDASVKVTNEKEVVFKVGTKEITKGELATALNTYKYDSTVEIVRNHIYDEFAPVNEEVNKKVAEELESLKQRVSSSTVSWEDNLKNSGTTEEEYKEKVLLPAVRADILAKKYLETTFTARVEQYRPIKIQVIETKNQESANQAIEAIKAGKTFVEAKSEFGSGTATKGLTGEVFVTFNGAAVLEENLYQTALNAKVNEVQSVKSSSSENVFVYQVVSNDANTFKDEAITALVSHTSVISDSFAHYLAEKKIAIYDIDVYNKFEKEYKSSILNQK